MPVKPCVSPVTPTDELLAQVVGLLGDVLDRLPEQPKQPPNLVREPARKAAPKTSKPVKETRNGNHS